ncbi:hypothetical protein BKA65DRAFT_485235 [Rhexocercosporidium sp. MPI-PUGE-AT-0058]|nr:hypothetical protein BKA65DRAFT_485235 [Rhexocercosporidium sp. MPI-PUGE-AT-0058]
MSDNLDADGAAMPLFRLQLADPDQDLSIQTLSSFTLFPKLPLELRCMIYRRMFPGARRFVMYEYRPDSVDLCEICINLPLLPITFHLNQEARQETLRHYQVLHMQPHYLLRSRSALLNPKTDVFQCGAVEFMRWIPYHFFGNSWDAVAKSFKFLELTTNDSDQAIRLQIKQGYNNEKWDLFEQMTNLSEVVLRGLPTNESIQMEDWRLEMKEYFDDVQVKALDIKGKMLGGEWDSRCVDRDERRVEVRCGQNAVAKQQHKVHLEDRPSQ